jgi:hypothetical protein
VRDPNGYVIELTANTGIGQDIMHPAVSKPHEALARSGQQRERDNPSRTPLDRRASLALYANDPSRCQ